MPDDLALPPILPPDDVLDRGRLDQDLDAQPPDRLLPVLKAAHKAGVDAIARAADAQPWRGPDLAAARAWLTDGIVQAVHRQVTWRITPGIELPVAAVGGYGRGEMAPHSDVDLLILIPARGIPPQESVEALLYPLWDLGLKVGHAVRNVWECTQMARDDATIRTTLLEARHIAGETAPVAQLQSDFWDLAARTGSDYVEAKLAEREDRLRRFGAVRYRVEPNLKEGKGGLRDLQTLYWIAKYLHHGASRQGMVEAGVFSADDLRVFEAAESFLWSTRVQLHLVSGRPNETLSFDVQPEVARRLGYVDAGGRRAVEHFMTDYFTQAKNVGDLTRIFLAVLEARHVKRRASLRERFGLVSDPPVPDGYRVVHGRIDIADRAAFLTDPKNLLDLFRAALESGLLIHPNAMRTVVANLHRIEDIQADPAANQLFLSILLDYANPERALRRMNEMGVLGAFIPEFGRIVAMMQFNMYHHYTVDEHTIQCVAHLARIEAGELRDTLPMASEILSTGVNRRVLYVALLCHDIGKGSARDHSEAGAEIAHSLAVRFGLDDGEVETVEWLVRHHLLMSDVAQKRDLSDARTITDFAREVQSLARLRLLLCLTVCDISGVGPGTWNNWKATLLRECYSRTRSVLVEGNANGAVEDRVEHAQAALAQSLAGWQPKAVQREMERHFSPYWMGLDTATQALIARMLHALEPDGIATDVTPDTGRAATRVVFALQDHPGITARLAGAVALAGAEVRDARSYTTKDGFVAAVFWIQDEDGTPFTETRLPRLRRLIDEALAGEFVARDALAPHDKPTRRAAPFSVPTTICFDNDGSELYTIIEVSTRDRPGLLHDLTRTLTAENVGISSAVIATYGAQAVDTFYVRDLFGQRIHGADKQRRIEDALRRAIDEGQRRAGA